MENKILYKCPECGFIFKASSTRPEIGHCPCGDAKDGPVKMSPEIKKEKQKGKHFTFPSSYEIDAKIFSDEILENKNDR